MKEPRTAWRCDTTLLCLTVMAGLLLAASPGGGTVTLTDPSPVTKAFTADGSAVITTTPIKALAGSEFNSTLLNAGYPGWTIKTPTAAPGNFSVTSYKAGSQGALGGANFEVTYDNGAGLPQGQQLRWVQFTSTNVPPGGTASPYIDPFPTDDNLPFYWTNDQLFSYATAKTLKFADYAKRDATLLSSNNLIKWQGNLFLTTYDGGTTLTPLAGLQWGFEMKSAIQGSSSGKFLNPAPANAVVSGLKTAILDYGVPTKIPPSRVIFESVEFNPAPGEVFTFGKLTFNNNSTIGGTEIDRIDLEISLNFTNVPEKNITLTTPLTVVSTINTGDYSEDMDHVSLLADDKIFSFYVPERGSAEVEILGKIVTTPVITGISQDKSLLPFGDLVSDVLFNFELMGFGPWSGYGVLTEEKFPQAPLPGTAGLTALGLSLLALRARRQSKPA